MHWLIESEIVNPSALSREERDSFLNRLSELNQKIFAGVSRGQLKKKIFPSGAARTRVQVYRNELGTMVGYCAVHLYEIQSGSSILNILRAEAGLLAGYRGSAITLWFGAKEALGVRMWHPFQTLALFATPVHPSSYHMLCRYFWRCYPYPGRRTPEKWHRLLLELVESSGGPMVDPTDPLIRRVDWITKESEADAAAWHDSPHEDVRYYVTRNPGYRRGHGLAMIAPLSMGNLIISSIYYLWHFIQNWLRSRAYH